MLLAEGLRCGSLTVGPRCLARCRRLVVIAALTLGGTVQAADQDVWVGAWGFPSTSAAFPVAANTSAPSTARSEPPDFANVTVRQIVRISSAATRLRIRISNEFGERPLRLESVHVALAGPDGTTVPGSDHVVTFAGASSTVVPLGAPMLSDPIVWTIPALTQLAISSFVRDDTKPPAHRLASYVSSSGEFGAAERMPGAQLQRTGALVSELDIVSRDARRTVVTLGDSITEGFGSTPNAFKGWSDRLAERLAADPVARTWSLLNAGINSNRLLHDNPGASALARFDRDVLSVPAVGTVVLLEGINDIGYSQTRPEEAVTAEEIIAAYRQLIARAHVHCISIIAGTLTPFEDSHYFDAHGEQMRQAVNAWIRTSKAFDGVIDFDAALRDPEHPASVASSLQHGDHLHPNDAGYSKMAEAIDLNLFKQKRASTCTVH